jgi:hypothetical protein
MATYFDLTIVTLKRQLFTLLDSNVKKLVSRRQKEKVQKTSETFKCVLWSLEDFSVKLKLINSSINPHCDIDFNVVSHEQFIQVFGKKYTNGFKVKVNEHLVTQECDSLSRLHQVVYAHPPANGDYPSIFF